MGGMAFEPMTALMAGGPKAELRELVFRAAVKVWRDGGGEDLRRAFAEEVRSAPGVNTGRTCARGRRPRP